MVSTEAQLLWLEKQQQQQNSVKIGAHENPVGLSLTPTAISATLIVVH
jgi:hypothetical protein